MHIQISLFFYVGILIFTIFTELSLCTCFNVENIVKLFVPDSLNDMKCSIIDDNNLDDSSNARLNRHSIEAIYQFGDSLSDTGNYIYENPYSSFGQYPYGETYFQRSVGRCSDGLLMIDNLANFLNLPFLNAYLNKDGNFAHGANFAVVGATALDVSSLLARNIKPSVTNHSLSVQLGWFKSHLNAIYSNKSGEIGDRKKKMAKALFVIGEIGGNDYNFAIAAGKQPPYLNQMIPEVVQTISNVVLELISLGATQIIVPGNLLMGCMTLYLSSFRSDDLEFYDDLNCIKSLNEFSILHNNKLRHAIKKIQKHNPHVTIVYMNLAHAMKKIIQRPTSHGFDEDGMFKACCGNGDEDYNFNSSSICGMHGVLSCEDPKKHFNWDGYHLTHHAYHVMAKSLFKQMFFSSCAT